MMKDISSKSWIKGLIGDEDNDKVMEKYFSTLVSVIVNFVIIPSFITYTAEFEDHEYKSNKNTTIIFRMFIFMVANILILPVIGFTSIKQLLEKYQDRSK